MKGSLSCPLRAPLAAWKYIEEIFIPDEFVVKNLFIRPISSSSSFWLKFCGCSCPNQHMFSQFVAPHYKSSPMSPMTKIKTYIERTDLAQILLEEGCKMSVTLLGNHQFIRFNDDTVLRVTLVTDKEANCFGISINTRPNRKFILIPVLRFSWWFLGKIYRTRKSMRIYGDVATAINSHFPANVLYQMFRHRVLWLELVLIWKMSKGAHYLLH